MRLPQVNSASFLSTFCAGFLSLALGCSFDQFLLRERKRESLERKGGMGYVVREGKKMEPWTWRAAGQGICTPKINKQKKKQKGRRSFTYLPQTFAQITFHPSNYYFILKNTIKLYIIRAFTFQSLNFSQIFVLKKKKKKSTINFLKTSYLLYLANLRHFSPQWITFN